MKVALIILGVLLGLVLLLFLFLFVAAILRRPNLNNTKGYLPLEKTLFEELYKLFDSEIQQKLRAQLNYFESSRKWRQYWEKSMSVELYGDNQNPLSDDLRYNRKDESKLASVNFWAAEEKYNITFRNYDGRVWGWNIKPKPKKIKKLTEIKVSSSRILNDPNDFVQPTPHREKFKELPKFTGFLAELVEKYKLVAAYSPLGPEYLPGFIDRVQAKLPEDYLEILDQSEGVEFEGFHILGASEIRTTALDDGDYYHLAEFGDGVVCVKEYDETGAIYYCAFSGLIDPLGTDFKAAILNILEA